MQFTTAEEVIMVDFGELTLRGRRLRRGEGIGGREEGNKLSR